MEMTVGPGSRPPHIAIIGGGFSGTLAAVNLARLGTSALRVTVVNDGRPFGRGVAYGTARPEHVLNVAARNMSALPDHPNHFLQWLRTRCEYAGLSEPELRELFAPRRVYGDYLRGLALPYLHPPEVRSPVALETIESEATDIEAAGGRARIVLADGQTLEADKVLLATGNEPPSDLPGSGDVAAHPAWCANPWTDWESRLPADGDIVLLGTGLTTIDALVTLFALDWNGTIHAVSRNGLLPESHFKGVDDPHFPPTGVALDQVGLAALVRLVEEHCQRLRAAGLNPAMVVDKLRPHTQGIWAGFSEVDRREFIARHAARWNVIRHRIAPAIHQQVTAALETGRLRIVRASVTGVRSLGNRIGVEVRAADGTDSCLEAAFAINGTGPHTRFSATRSPLLRNLLRRGLATPDAMDMGMRIEADFAAVDREGQRSPFLFAIGPLLRGTLWETVAVPELRHQAWQVARTLLGTPATAPAPAAEAVIEYEI